MTDILERPVRSEATVGSLPLARLDAPSRRPSAAPRTTRESMPGGYTVPAHRVREFARLSVRHGWDARTVLTTVGITSLSLTQPCPSVTLEKSVAVLRYLWLVTDDEFLRLGPRRVCRDTLRALALAICTASTLREALDRVERFTPVFGGLPVISVSTESDLTTISFDLDGFDRDMSLVVDSVLAVTHRAINWGTRRRLQLVRMVVPYARPRGETDHDLVFGVPVQFNAPEAAITFASSDLTLPLLRRPEEIEDFIADVPTVLLSEIDFYSTNSQRVRAIIERGLGDRTCTADEIAASLGISRQTLRRRLHAEGTSVSAIRDDVLRATALDSLTQGGETVSALAARLGFSEPSAFTRAFRRWTGVSPTSFAHNHNSSKSLG